MLREYWEKFYNFFIREVSTTTKAITLCVLIGLSFLLLVLSFRGKGSGIVNTYIFFFLSIICAGLAVAYSIMTN